MATPGPCFPVAVLNPNRIWQTDNVLKKELPILAVQICVAVLWTRLFFFIYKPLHQPRIISQVAAGFLLTPPLLGQFPKIFQIVFPVEGVINVEVLGQIGLIYYAFITGLEMNLNTILHVKKKAGIIAIAGIIFPTLMGPAFYHLYRKTYLVPQMLEPSTFNAYLLWTLVLTVTGFPVLAHILSDLKLIYTGLGKAALTAAMVSDTYSWILFTIFIPFAINGERGIYSVLGTALFVLTLVFLVRPIVVKIIDDKTERDDWEDGQLIYVMMGIFFCSYVTDVLGTHSIVGAFVWGLILPHGRFADLVASVTDDFGGGFLAPHVFIGNGMKLFVKFIFIHPNWPATLMVILLMCIPKILSTVFAGFFYGTQSRDSLALGLLLNTKGAMAFIMLNIAWDKSIFYGPSYVVITSAVLLMTVVVGPIINFVYRPRKRFEQNKLKTIQKLRSDAELRIVACVHNSRHAVGMIGLIESFNATRLSPIHVFALYLVELTGRTTALLAAHLEKPSSQPGEQNLTKSQEELENINHVLDAFGEAYDAVRVQTSDIVSVYATIHEDIYNSANEKHTSLVILPFHKQLTSEGSLEVTNVAYRDINLNVMQSAPCSVGIFVDRDLGPLPKKNFHIVMLFIGGPDDREALAIAWRMGGHPGIKLSVVRMLLFDEAAEVDTTNHSEAQGILSAVVDNERQRELDDDYINSFRLTAANNDDSVTYSEVDVHKAEEISLALNELQNFGCNLYIVGQGNGRNSRVFSNLLEWCDCLELGVIGDILASNNFGSCASVLVVQQYGYGGMNFRKQPNNANTNIDGFESLVVKTE